MKNERKGDDDLADTASARLAEALWVTPGELFPIDTVLQVEKAQSSTGENVPPAAPSEHPGHVLWNMEFISPQAQV